MADVDPVAEREREQGAPERRIPDREAGARRLVDDALVRLAVGVLGHEGVEPRDELVLRGREEDREVTKVPISAGMKQIMKRLRMTLVFRQSTNRTRTRMPAPRRNTHQSPLAHAPVR